MNFKKEELTDPDKAPYVTCAYSGFIVPQSECVVVDGMWVWGKFAPIKDSDVVSKTISKGGK
jgi:hypothetical protein